MDNRQTPKTPKMSTMALPSDLFPQLDQPSYPETTITFIAPRFVDVELSSNQEASTYHDGSSPVHSSEYSLQADSVEKDQGEENTNFMMRVLLNYICAESRASLNFAIA